MDLLENLELVPKQVREIIERFDDNKELYKECERILKLLELFGYVFDYDLSGTPFDLKKIY